MDVLTSPVILFFVLGGAAALIRSDLAVPEMVSKAVTLYLLAAIGLKGGVQLSESGYSDDLVIAGFAGVALSFLLPLPAFWVVRWLGRLNRADAGAVAAHYGSVSVVTFVTGIEVLKDVGLPAEGYMVAVMALMEAPAILTGLWLARAGRERGEPGSMHLAEALTNGSVVLLAGSFVIGLVVGREGFVAVAPLFEGGFRGMLCLFLLDMGLTAARQLMRSKNMTPALGVSAIGLALLNGMIGVGVGTMAGMSPGSAAALGILAGSASYIAAPAAVRVALPHANIGLSLTMSLAITFPFNVIVGIPFIVAMARWLGAA
jgi:hypothetical protein